MRAISCLLFGVKIVTPFRVIWSLAAYVGVTLKLGFVWLLADTLNALMEIRKNPF